jgi:myo-inositol-1(or 4)-monophosphatase
MESRMIDTNDLLACAVDAVQVATRHALDNLSRRTEMVKLAEHDVKLCLDIECQAKAEVVIQRHFPDHVTLGEEDVATREHNIDDYEWVIDPIDGTVNFSHSIPFWGCSIAVQRNGVTLAGAVLAPEVDQLFTATINSPALCNGKPIKVSTTNSLSESIIYSGADQNVGDGIPPYTYLNKVAARCQRPRIMGCASLDLCRVASGEGDGYFECGIYIWDIIAAGLIVRQAGGRAEIIGERSGGRLLFLGTNGLIHDELKKAVL